jgi:hypothetical protein
MSAQIEGRAVNGQKETEMTMATVFVTMMSKPDAWNVSAQHSAKRIDPAFDYDRLERDLAFYYFSDGSIAGVRPMSHQAWISGEVVAPQPE